MNKKNLMPQQAQPIERITTGQIPECLAELSEETLFLAGVGEDSSSVLPLGQAADQWPNSYCWCSYDGDDAE